MDWQAALRARLLADGAVSALIGTRVYWLERPQASALPSVTLQVISDGRPQHMKGFHDLRGSRVQADAWAADHKAAFDLGEAVIAALVPAGTFGGVEFERGFVEGVRDLGDETAASADGRKNFIHRASIDFIIHHA